MAKAKDAFRTISEVAEWLDTPTHVLRFWESKFSQIKPVKGAGGRRYYRPADMDLLGGIKQLLHEDGLTIKGTQKLLREEGVKHVASLGLSMTQDTMQDAASASSDPAPQKEPAPDIPPAPQPEPTPEPTQVPPPTPSPDHPPQPTPTPTPDHPPQPTPTPTPDRPPQPTPAPGPDMPPAPTPAGIAYTVVAHGNNPVQDALPFDSPAEPSSFVIDHPLPPKDLPSVPARLIGRAPLDRQALTPHAAQIAPLLARLEALHARMAG